MIWFYLLSGLFLGWSLGANDAANIFGTAVATQMVKFRVAAIIATIFVILGAVLSGSGTTETLGDLGAVNALAGSFTVALAAAGTVTWMTRQALPVSTSQAIVGAIVGWNLFTGSPTDLTSLIKIVSTWIISPVLAGVFSAVLFLIARATILKIKLHMLRIDAYNRIALIVIGAFGAYSLGANNIANVVGVFAPASPFNSATLPGGIHFSGSQQLFLVGALAIGVGIYTYSYRVMQTVGNDLFKLTPVTALIVVLSESLVLYLFASKSIHYWMLNHGIPPLPLVPLSSSQAVIGAVLGLAIAKGTRGVQFGVLGRVASGWVVTPLIALIVSFIALFFAQNLFEMKVVAETPHNFSQPVIQKIRAEGLASEEIRDLEGLTFNRPQELRESLQKFGDFNETELLRIFSLARVENLQVDTTRTNREILTGAQYRAVKNLHGQSFLHGWQLHQALQEQDSSWQLEDPANRLEKMRLEQKLDMVIRESSQNQSLE